MPCKSYVANSDIICSQSSSGSTATIIRLPYISSMNDEQDFLFSTIDVAIWSTCETGIGLAVSSAATLRPLMRHTFGDISLTGGSSRKISRNWVGPSRTRSGYLPHSSVGDDSDIALKDSPKSPGIQITTHGVTNDTLSRNASTASLRDWDGSEKGSEDKIVTDLGGIRKTVQITQC